MNAKEAAKITEREQAKQYKARVEREQQERAENEAAAKTIAKSLITQLEAEIPEAAKKGCTVVTDEGPHSSRRGAAYAWACSIACEHFRKLGYKADHHDGEREMGDTEYPCTDYYHTIWVSWGRDA